MSFGGWGGAAGRTISISLAPGQTPAKALISLNPKIYAGTIEFRDIPMPVLPPLP